MAVPLAMDLRVRVMKDVDAGMSAEKASVKYSISARTIYAWKKLRRDNGSLEPRSRRHGPQPKLNGRREEILQAQRENPDLTLEELRSQLGLEAGISTLWTALTVWGQVLKKSAAGRRTEAA